MRISILYGILLTMGTLAGVMIPAVGQAERIRDLTTVQGVRENALIGYGLVVGLDGTGDQTQQTPFTTQSLSNMLSQLGITVPQGTNMQLKNVAAVMVTAQLPPFVRPGQKIDVVVSSMGSAKSLRGGTLLMTPLKGVDNQVYAVAQGNVLVSGAGTQAGGNRLQINTLNGGRISGGAIVERGVPADFASGNSLILQLNSDNFSLAQQISDAINRRFGRGTSLPLDSRTINVTVPASGPGKVRFMADVQNLAITPGPADAVVIVNARTGSVVMNRNVVLDACAVAHGDLTVEISRTQKVIQPDTPFGGGKTVVVPKTSISLNQQGGSLQQVSAGTSLSEVVSALNGIGATPNDLMAILQSMQSAGCLNARLEIN